MILIHILIGAICTSIILYIISYLNKKDYKLKIWQWLLILIEVVYVGFVLELIVGFIEEGSGKAAVVMGTIFGLLGLIGAVLIVRFIILKK